MSLSLLNMRPDSSASLSFIFSCWAATRKLFPLTLAVGGGGMGEGGRGGGGGVGEERGRRGERRGEKRGEER